MTKDRFDRPLRSLRISVTDRGNLHCHYCMPEPDYGGEPLLPRDLPTMNEQLAAVRPSRTGADRRKHSRRLRS